MKLTNLFRSKKEREIIKLQDQLRNQEISEIQFYMKLQELDAQMYVNQVPDNIDYEITKYKQ
jgi:hypothetical protein